MALYAFDRRSVIAIRLYGFGSLPMNRSNNGAHSRTPNTSGGKSLEGRASTDSQFARLQKKRSTGGGLTASLPLRSSAGNSGGLETNSGRVGELSKARKGSLRNAVRKIFRRRSKVVDSQPLEKTPPRHGYHRSEPPALAPHVEGCEPHQQ